MLKKFRIIVAQWGDERVIVHAYPEKHVSKGDYQGWIKQCYHKGMRWKSRARKHMFKTFKNEFQALIFAGDLTELLGEASYEVFGKLEIKVSTVSGGLI